MLDFRLLLLVAVVIISTVPLAEANQDRITELMEQIAELEDRIIVLEGNKNGINDVDIDDRIQALRDQIAQKQAIIDSLINTSGMTIEERITALHEKMGGIINMLHKLVAEVARVQAELFLLVLFEPAPITLPMPTDPINTVPPIVTVNGTTFGHNDTIRVIGTPGTLINDGPPRVDGTEPILREEHWSVSIRGDRSSVGCSFSYDEDHGWSNNTDRFDTCTLDANGLINGTVSVPGHFHAGFYQASFYHEISWSNDYDNEQARSPQFIIR